MTPPDEAAFPDLDRTIHAPARLQLTALLYTSESADFTYLLTQTGLTKGNLAAHLAKLEQAGYLEVQKTYRGRVPQTLYRLTDEGRAAFKGYREGLASVLRLTQAPQGA